MSVNPIDNLEIEALQQRAHVHHTIVELKDKVVGARAKLNPNSNARDHFLGAALAVSSLAFLSGYGFAGLFT